MKKLKRKYLEEVRNEKWKSVHAELPTIVKWDDNLQSFLCKNEEGGYYCEWNEFFKKHVIVSNNCKWTPPFEKTILNRKSLASWLCLINGHNIYEDNKVSYEMAGKSVKSSESSHLSHYIADRYEDAIYSLDNGTIPSWIVDYLLTDMEENLTAI